MSSQVWLQRGNTENVNRAEFVGRRGLRGNRSRGQLDGHAGRVIGSTEKRRVKAHLKRLGSGFVRAGTTGIENDRVGWVIRGSGRQAEEKRRVSEVEKTEQ